MADRVTAHIVVEFGTSEADLFMSAEVDSRPTGLNGNKTSFSPGDSVALLLFKHDLLTLVTTDVTAGSLNPIGTEYYQVTDQIITFTDDSDETTLTYPVYDGFTYKWVGVDRGAVSVSNGNTLRKALPGIGVLKVSYRSRATAYRLYSPTSVSGETTFPIVVLFVGNTAD